MFLIERWMKCWIVCCPFTQRKRWLRVVGYVFLAHHTQSFHSLSQSINQFNTSFFFHYSKRRQERWSGKRAVELLLEWSSLASDRRPAYNPQHNPLNLSFQSNQLLAHSATIDGRKEKIIGLKEERTRRDWPPGAERVVGLFFSSRLSLIGGAHGWPPAHNQQTKREENSPINLPPREQLQSIVGFSSHSHNWWIAFLALCWCVVPAARFFSWLVAGLRP